MVNIEYTKNVASYILFGKNHIFMAKVGSSDHPKFTMHLESVFFLCRFEILEGA
jgi:hypothetical protein